MITDLPALLRLAGFALAHAAWPVEDGETLVTLAFLETETGDRELVRYEFETIPEALDAAHEHLAEQLRGGGQATLVVDGYMTPEGGERTDALFVELFGNGGHRVGKIAQAYRPAKRSRIPFVGRASGFAILGEPAIDQSIDVENAERLLLEGIREHPHGERLFGSSQEPGTALS